MLYVFYLPHIKLGMVAHLLQYKSPPLSLKTARVATLTIYIKPNVRALSQRLQKRLPTSDREDPQIPLIVGA